MWNFDRFDINSSIWVQEAFHAKKYAFAADYIRCHALYHYGGIYLDMDVEVLKSFDDLLYLPYFIGKEDSTAAIEAAIIGAEKNHVLFQKMMNYYKDRHFILADNNFDTVVLPRIIRTVITKNFNTVNISSVDDFVDSPQSISIFPVDWFSPKSLITGEINITPNTYTIHHFSASWCGRKERLYRWVLKTFGVRLAHSLSVLYKKTMIVT